MRQEAMRYAEQVKWSLTPRSRATASVKRGDWKKAAMMLRRAAETSSELEPGPLASLALVELANGNVHNYSRECDRLWGCWLEEKKKNPTSHGLVPLVLFADPAALREMRPVLKEMELQQYTRAAA